MFPERMKQLREECQLPLRRLAATFDSDSAAYWKIKRGKRCAKREQIPFFAEILQAVPEELLTFWFVDQVAEVVADEKEIADKALNIVKENIAKYERRN
jgi:hypothetical protein